MPWPFSEIPSKGVVCRPDEGLRLGSSPWIDFSLKLRLANLSVYRHPSYLSSMTPTWDSIIRPAAFRLHWAFTTLTLVGTLQLLATAHGRFRFNAPATGQRVYHYSRHWSAPAGCNPGYEEGHRSAFLLDAKLHRSLSLARIGVSKTPVAGT